MSHPNDSKLERSGRIFVDALAHVGPRSSKHFALPWNLDHVINEMAHCSISGSLVWSTMSVCYDAMFGNRRLSAALADHPQLLAGWNLLPTGTDEFPDHDDLLRKMRDANVRAVSIHPRANAWNLMGAYVVPLFRALARQQIPCFLHRGQLESWSQLENFLIHNPELPLVLSGVHFSEQRQVIPLVKAHANLHLTLETLQMNNGYADLYKWGLGDRVLFGTNSPAMSPGAQRCAVDCANIPDKAKDAIASGNLLRLLQWTDPVPLQLNEDDDLLVRAAQRGEPLPEPVIDLHMHILDEGLHGGGGAFRMSQGAPSATFRQLAQLGVVGGGFMSWNGTVGGDSLDGNRCVQAALDAAPPGFWGLATFDPCNYSQAELSRLIPAFYEADTRFIGMKPYFTYKVEYHHPSYDVWWKTGNALGLYAGIHRVRNDFAEVDALATKYPNVRWVVYHCGSNYATADAAIECMAQHPNVFAEITFTSVTTGIIDYLVEHAGVERVLYGSDLPMRDPTPQLGWVLYSRLTLEQKLRVLGKNAAAIIAPCRKRLPAYNLPECLSKL